MSIINDIVNLARGGQVAWDQPYDRMTTQQLVAEKGKCQAERDASSDPIVQSACNARMAIVNRFLDQRVAEDDANRILENLSPDAQKAIVLKVQNMKQESRVNHG